MSNWFAGIGQAASGLNAARYGLSVVSQNIANADTPGYTRQSSVQATVGTGNVAAIHTTHTTTDTLGGVTVTGTQRSDDPVLDARVRSEHARGALASTTSGTFSDIESLFPEPSDDGLGGQLGDFWSAWSSVATDPGTSATRGVLLQKANTVVATLHTMSSSLSDVVTQTSADLDADMATANTTAAQLADLNGQIAIGTATGTNVNSLLDKRDQLLDTLSSTVGATATLAPNGTATVTVGGQTLVSGTTAASMAADPSTHQVSVSGTAVTLSASSAAARVTALTTTLPGYQSQLDAVANSLKSMVNSVQGSGYDLNGAAGTDMFSGSGAAGITVAITDPSKIAASATPGGTLDGSNALAASRQGTATNGPDATYTALVGDVAGASALAQQQASTQASVVSNVDDLKASVSGVNYDEEVSTMLVYQRSFQASSRVLTTLDDMLDTLINHTGHVGLA